MRLPTVAGVIRRRLLLNFRVDPDVIAKQLPAPFVPKLHKGHAVAGICLIRLEHIRPLGIPRVLGFSSENAAHRIAVQWQAGGVPQEGVFIPRRDSDSWINQLAGGRVFPGEHHAAPVVTVDDGAREWGDEQAGHQPEGREQPQLRDRSGSVVVGAVVDDVPLVEGLRRYGRRARPAAAASLVLERLSGLLDHLTAFDTAALPQLSTIYRRILEQVLPA